MSGFNLTARRYLAPLSLSVLAALWANACLSPIWAEAAANRITDISVDASGQLILTVEGDGVDPLVRLETAPNQQYRIIIQGQGAMLNPNLVKDTTVIAMRIRQRVPAVDSAQLSTNDQDTEQFQLVLTSWQKLQPQIKSNTGSRIVIALIGNHALPPAVQARQQHAAELKRQAELKAAAARQAEEQWQKAEAKRKLQAELQRKRLEEQVARQREAQQQRAEAQKKQAEAARKLAEQKKEQLVAASKPTENPKPLPTIPAGPLQADWVTAYRPQGQPAPDEALAQLQLVQSAPKAFSPTMLALDKIPPPKPVLPGLSSDANNAPTEPLRLNAPPPGLFQNADPFNPGFNPLSPKTGQPGGDASFWSPNANTATRKAWQEIQGGNTTSAEMELRSYLEKSPDDAEARYLLGRILMRPATEALAASEANPDSQARRDAARQEFMKILRRKPHLQASIALAQMSLDDENVQDASALLSTATAAYPDSAMLLYLKGRLHEGLNAPGPARDAYYQALTKEPNLLEALFHLAQLEISAGRMDAARWSLNQAISVAPTDSRLWKLLGFVAEKQNEPQKAAQFYRQALQPDALINYARSLEAQNQPEKAMTIYQAVETLAGDDIDILYNLGMIYAAMRQGNRAEAVLERFLELNKDMQDSRIAQAKSTLKQLGHKPGTRSTRQPRILPF